MGRFISKLIGYYILFAIIILLHWSSGLNFANAVALAAILAGFNTLLRPILTLIAIPLTFLTFGIASIFTNLLTIVISNAIMGNLLQWGFWPMLLLAAVILISDHSSYLSRVKQDARAHHKMRTI